MGLAPLFWLAFLHWRGRDPGLAWWWLALAFAVSWLADVAAHWGNSWLVGLAYPVSQSVLVGFVFLSKRDALELIIALVLIGLLDVILFGVHGPDILLRTAAWGAVVGIVYPLRQLGRLRTSLLVAFGGGWILWMAYAVNPSWGTWSAYQITRLLGILLFCWAATSPLPQLKVVRTRVIAATPE